MRVRIRLRGSVGRWAARTRQVAGAEFVTPFAARTAVLAQGFRATNSVRVFGDGWCAAAARFAPEVIAGWRWQMALLAAREERPAVSHGLVVMRRDNDEALSWDERDALWRAFGVPVFEQVWNGKDELVAFECEAHGGLHLVRETAWAQSGAEAECGCGSKVRLLPANIPARQMAAAAA